MGRCGLDSPFTSEKLFGDPGQAAHIPFFPRIGGSGDELWLEEHILFLQGDTADRLEGQLPLLLLCLYCIQLGKWK